VNTTAEDAEDADNRKLRHLNEGRRPPGGSHRERSRGYGYDLKWVSLS